MTYAEKLKDPRWQKRRLQVLERAGWKCEFCGDAESTLHVHHLGYKGEPWEAPDDMLECLCEQHHKMRHENSGFIGRIDFGVNLTAKEAKCLQDCLILMINAFEFKRQNNGR